MSASQIWAILQLLVAFYVPQDRVDAVQAILETANRVSSSQVAPIPSVPAQGFGSVETPAAAPTPQPAPLLVSSASFQKDSKGQYKGMQKLVFITTTSEVSLVAFKKPDGSFIASSTPTITSSYTDGNYQYFAYAPKPFEQYGNGETVYFYAAIETQDGRSFKTKMWRAYNTETQGWLYAECVADYCPN